MTIGPGSSCDSRVAQNDQETRNAMSIKEEFCNGWMKDLHDYDKTSLRDFTQPNLKQMSRANFDISVFESEDLVTIQTAIIFFTSLSRLFLLI